MDRVLSHEKLLVYKRSLEFIEFIEFVEKIFSRQKEKISAVHQLDRASTSIPLNIAEGTGKFTSRDKNRFYDIARGSAAESGACLDVLLKKIKLVKLKLTKARKY